MSLSWLLAFADDVARHVGDFRHELVALHFAALPSACSLNSQFAGQFRRDQFRNAQAAQQRDQRKRLGRGLQFAAVAHDVFFVDQTFDDRRARGGRAEAFLAHRFAQFLVLDEFARAFHRAEQRGFRIARRRLGLVAFTSTLLGLDRSRSAAPATRLGVSSDSALPCRKPRASPALTITLPSLLNGSPSTRVMRVVTRNSAAG